MHIRRALDDEEDERDRRAPRARSIRQHTSAYVSIRQHTSAYAIRRALADEEGERDRGALGAPRARTASSQCVFKGITHALKAEDKGDGGALDAGTGTARYRSRRAHRPLIAP